MWTERYNLLAVGVNEAARKVRVFRVTNEEELAEIIGWLRTYHPDWPLADLPVVGQAVLTSNGESAVLDWDEGLEEVYPLANGRHPWVEQELWDRGLRPILLPTEPGFWTLRLSGPEARTSKPQLLYLGISASTSNLTLFTHAGEPIDPNKAGIVLLEAQKYVVEES